MFCRRIPFIFGLLAFGFMLSPDVARGQSAPDFWDHWGDGKAEVSSYRLQTPRYGELRDGEAVLIFVTETMSATDQVKIEDRDRQSENSPDAVPVLKLNEVRSFQTGIYDYRLMTSVFTPITEWTLGGQSREAGLALKLSFVSTEWCGNYFAQMNRTSEGFEVKSFSYFGGEGDRVREYALEEAPILEDNLFVRVREWIRPLPSGRYTMFSSVAHSRLNHSELEWEEVVVKRNELERPLSGVLGHTKGVLFEVTHPARQYRIWVEAEAPRRILKWTLRHSLGTGLEESGVLSGTMRTAYWRQNSNADAELRSQLSLPNASLEKN